MKKLIIPRIGLAASHNLRGKAAEITFNKEPYLHHDPESVNKEILRIRKSHSIKHITKHPTTLKS